MAGSNRSSVFGVLPETLVIGASIAATLAPIAAQDSLILKYGSGGTLFVLSSGATLPSGTSFATASKYLVGTSEILNLGRYSGPLVLGAEGATTTCYLLRGRSE
jgi:hypothetical protein